jgi:hypothetical protein
MAVAGCSPTASTLIRNAHERLYLYVLRRGNNYTRPMRLRFLQALRVEVPFLPISGIFAPRIGVSAGGGKALNVMLVLLTLREMLNRASYVKLERSRRQVKKKLKRSNENREGKEKGSIERISLNYAFQRKPILSNIIDKLKRWA